MGSVKRYGAPSYNPAVEGPQVRHYRDWVNRFLGRRLVRVAGERAAEAEPLVGRLLGRSVSRGKLLFIHFRDSDQSLRVHCLMFGDLRVNEPRAGKRLTLRLDLEGGDFIAVHLGAVRRVPRAQADEVPRELDIMDPAWDPALAWRLARRRLADQPLTDALLDQAVFPGLGNKVKTEALFLARLHPLRHVRDVTPAEARRLMSAVRSFARLMGRAFGRGEHIQPHMHAYRRRTCPACGGAVVKQDLGALGRRNHFCPTCQPLVPERTARPLRSRVSQARGRK